MKWIFLLISVTLMNGASEYGVLTEEHSGSGVVLPSMEDTADWHFVGWSEIEFWSLDERPLYLHHEGTVFKPESDMTLWAAYIYRPQVVDTLVTDLQTGTYIYLNTADHMAITGVASSNGTMSYMVANAEDRNMQYAVTFNAAGDSATIQHVATGTYIGYNSSVQLTNKVSPWLVYHEGGKTAFYAMIKGKSYILWPSAVPGKSGAGLYRTDNLQTTTTGLMAAREKTQVVYTCHPESGVGMHTISAEVEKEIIVPIGLYRLYIRNGKKYLRL